MMKKMDKKAFTLIELLVVIAVVGILVLLGVPRLLGYAQRAELARIQHDVRVIEQEIGAMLINKDDDFNKWRNNIKDLNQLVQDEELFEKKGPAVDPIDGTYKVIPEEYKGKINTKLKGTFYANSDGKVYYEHGKMPGYSDKEIDDLKNKGFIPIATAEDLNSVKSTNSRLYAVGTKWEKEAKGGLGLDKKYVQVADIDLSEYDNWTPIGTGSEFFKGTYDGGNYVITGLEIKGSGKDYQGLFGRTQGATIRNVGLIDNKVTGKSYVGGLVGRADYSKIINSYVTGSVKGTNGTGGLVGQAFSGTKISNSYATGDVKGRGQVGGLVGYAYSDVTISNSYTTGSAEGSFNVGGLVGNTPHSTSESIISNSYAEGSVTGSGNNIGGLVGSASNITIENSYATGSVTGAERVGGIVGDAEESTINNSYWDKETTGRDTSAGQDESFGKLTEDMKLKDTYLDWDFETVWKINEGDYPKLR